MQHDVIGVSHHFLPACRPPPLFLVLIALANIASYIACHHTEAALPPRDCSPRYPNVYTHLWARGAKRQIETLEWLEWLDINVAAGKVEWCCWE